jgi:hypothetical protein
MEVLRQMSEIDAVLTRLLLRQRLQLRLRLHGSVKDFLEVENLARRDRTLGVTAKFTKSLNQNLSVSVEWQSVFNSSTVDGFDYTKNGASVHLELTF